MAQETQQTPEALSRGPSRDDAAGEEFLVRRFTRREALQCGAAGLAGVSLVGWLGWRWWSTQRGGDIGTIFRGEAPADKLFALWQERGWVHEGYHYLKLGRNVQCKICPNNCLLEPGDRSHCRNKINRDGTLYTLAYANPCALHVDPVEKKPLFHFLPGTPTLSLATAGCVLRCLNCQNWDISQRRPEETKDPRGPELRLHPPLPISLDADTMNRLSLPPADVVAVAQSLGCRSVSYTYSEPVAFFEYTYDSCRLVREAGLRNIVVTSGSIEERPLRDLAQYVDAMHIDLKGFDESIYRTLNSGQVRTILGTLETLQSLGVWFEIINLVVPTYTDDLDGIRRMCDWIAAKLGPDRPLHFSRFHPAHRLAALPPTPVDVLIAARDLARAAGLRYVYIGNVRGVADAATTFCPQCHRAVVERDVYTVTANHVAHQACSFCDTPIPGVWT